MRFSWRMPNFSSGLASNCFGQKDEGGAGDAVLLLNEVELGYGCWLQDIRAATRAAKEDFHSHYASFYERFSGAASMAEAYLLNLDWMEMKNCKEVIEVLKRPRQPKQQ